MSSIVTAVFKATIGLLVNKGRDKAAEKLKDGDVTDEKIRGLIVREIEDVKKKLDGLSRKDLLASISFCKEGIELLYEVFAKLRPRSEDGAVTTQAACAEAFSLTQEMKNLELTDLDESAAMLLSNAKKRFEDSRRKATEAFNNEALATPDRILAMQYRVMATILETVDNPAIAVAPCRVCIEELNSLSAVRNSFNAQLKKGLGAARALFGKEERRKIISSVCHTNRVVYDVTLAISKDSHFWIWPAVNIEEGKVEPLCDERVKEVLSSQGMEHCCVTWSFGQEGKEKHKLKQPISIATNSSGHFIVGDQDRSVKVFDCTGTFMWLFSLYYHDNLLDLATDMNDNIYVLCVLNQEIINHAVYEFNKEGVLQHRFLLRGDVGTMGELSRLTVTDSGKVLVLRSNATPVKVDVYETDGRFVRSFGEDILNPLSSNITATNDGRVMVVDNLHSCVHVFSEDGDHIKMFDLQRLHYSPARIGFFRPSEHVVVASVPQGKPKHLLNVEIYTKDGQFVRCAKIHDKRIELRYRSHLQGMTVTNKGRIAVICGTIVLVI